MTTQEDLYFPIEESLQAREDCAAAAEAKSNHVWDECPGGGSPDTGMGLWHYSNLMWPWCEIINNGTEITCDSIKLWTGHYWIGTCPEGTTFSRDEGCVQEDEPRSCKIVASNPVVVGNPVNTATGSKYHKEVIDIDGGRLNFDLNYTSNFRIGHTGLGQYGLGELNHLAMGWKLSHELTISSIYEINGTEYVKVERPNGRLIVHEKVGSDWLPVLNGASDGQLTKTASGWDYVTVEGIESYLPRQSGDTFHLLKSKRFYDGSSLSYEHSGDDGDILIKVTDDYGNFLEFENVAHFSTRRIEKVIHSDGRVWKFDLDVWSHNLTKITYPDQTFKVFHYEDTYEDPNVVGKTNKHALTGITDRRGKRFATYQYDSDRRVIYEKHHAQDENGLDMNVEELSIVYNADNTRTITNSRGNVSTYEVEKSNGIWQIKSILGPGCSSCNNDNTDFVYDPVTNDLLSKTQDGVTTEYGGYDAKGQYAYKIEAAGTPDARRIDYTYDVRFLKKVTSISEPSVYSNQNKVTTYAYNDNGQMLSMTESGFKPDGTAISRTTTYEYNGPINQISRIDGPLTGNSDETLFTYYLENDPVELNQNRLALVVGAEGIVERDGIQWSSTGKVTEEQRPNGLTITNTYDPLNDRLVTSTQSDGVKSITTAFTYLATGHIESVTKNYGTSEASTLTLTYDDALRITRVTDGVGNYIQYTLDTEGNQEAEKTYDPNGVLKKIISQTFDTYDLLDSMTQSGVSVDYNYASNGVLDDMVNGNNVSTEYNYDNLKRLSSIKQDNGGTDPNTQNALTSFTYDSGERVETVTDARGNVTTYAYDDFGNLITLTSPDTGVTQYVYDVAGNMTQKTDAKGTTVNMSYDGRKRILSIDYSDNSLDTTYTYDQGTQGLGKLSSFTDQTGTTSFTYDAFGNLLAKTQVITGFNVFTYSGFNPLTTSYSYDTYNRVSALTYPSGITVNYEYDTLGQVNKVTSIIGGQTTTLADQVTYLPFGPMKSINFGNGKNFSANYDSGYRLQDYSYGNDIAATYGYDNNHNITSIARELVTHNDSFGYDTLDRLTDYSAGPTQYSYDKLGNRTGFQYGRAPVVSYTYEDDSSQLVQVGGKKPRSYDANGNTISVNEKGSYRWVYNQTNRMSEFYDGKTLRGEYFHNAIGQRIRKTQYKANSAMAGEFLFVYDEQGQLIHVSKYKNGNHIWDRETVWLGSRPIARIEIKYSGGNVSSQEIYYIQTDHLNTPRWITNDTGATVWSWETDAFGESTPNIDVDGDGTNFWFNMRFPGQYYDIESGLYYNYFRDYEPQTGRYVESDPIGLDGGLNTYSYVWNSPQMLVDPTGERGLGEGLRRLTKIILPWLNNDNSQENGLSLELEYFESKDNDDCEDDCKERLSEWKLKENGVDAHELKKDNLGRGAQISLYELCLCKDNTIAIRLKGCTGPTIRTFIDLRWGY